MKFIMNSTLVHQIHFVAIVQKWMTGQCTYLFSVSYVADIKYSLIATMHVFSMVIY